jgi:hypothetical protein
MRTDTIFHAPDGMNAGNRTQETRQSQDRRDEQDFDHDDGLVHEHNWARTSPERK